jgi:hypothetical protein
VQAPLCPRQGLVESAFGLEHPGDGLTVTRCQLRLFHQLEVLLHAALLREDRPQSAAPRLAQVIGGIRAALLKTFPGHPCESSQSRLVKCLDRLSLQVRAKAVRVVIHPRQQQWHGFVGVRSAGPAGL